MEFSWPIAAALIGTVVSIVLGIIKLYTLRDDKSGKAIDRLDRHNAFQDTRSENSRDKIQILSAEVSFLHSKVQAQTEALEKVEDLIIKILTEK